jgi:hypothetical protein
MTEEWTGTCSGNMRPMPNAIRNPTGIDLQPCPFCGTTDGLFVNHEPMDDTGQWWGCWVVCDRCHVNGPLCQGVADEVCVLQIGAVTSWNARPGAR